MTVTPAAVRIGLVGCGAVAQLYYAPALKTLHREGLVRLIAAYDPDPEALRAIAGAFEHSVPCTSFRALLDLSPELVLIASPPRHHAEQAIAALESNIDVHCEKPLASSFVEGERMVAAAAATGRRLSVGLLRRHLPATRAIKDLIGTGVLGRISSVQCFEGGPFTWPVRSAEYFQRAAGNAGVLQDIGAHCLDLLAWWLGAPSDVTYHDDAMGGVEANCRVDLLFGDARAIVRLSRDWERPNRYVIAGDQGWIGWTVNDSNSFDYANSVSEYVGAVAVHQRSGTFGRGSVAADFDAAFEDQLRCVVDPSGNRGDRLVSATEALGTLRLIDRCYASRQLMPMPWLLPVPEAGGR